MKKVLLLGICLVLGSYEAYAYDANNYLSVKAGYSAMKHKSKERDKNSPETPKYKWNGDVASGGVALGERLGDFRVEVEGSANSATNKRRNFYSDEGVINKTSVSKIKLSSAMLNAYYDLPTGFPIRPYIGAGAGMSHVKAQFKTRSEKETDKLKMSNNHFAWQVGAGITCEITSEWAADLGYRFMDSGNIVKKESHYDEEAGAWQAKKLKVSTKSHSAYLGVRYSF